MKWLDNNNLLFVILIALVSILYWDENILSQFSLHDETAFKLLPADIERIEYEGKIALKKNNNWLLSGSELSLDSEQINNYLKILQNVEVLENETSLPQNISQDFQVVYGSKRFLFYKPLQLTGNFYITIREKTIEKHFLCSTEQSFEGFYKDESDLKSKSYSILKSQLTDWKYNIFKLKIIPNSIDKIVRDFGGDKKVVINFKEKVTTPFAPQVLGYKTDVFEEFYLALKSFTPENILMELPREPKEWGNLIFASSKGDKQFGFYSLDGVYFLKSENIYFQLSEDDVSLLLKPINQFWGEQFNWLAKTFESLKSFEFLLGSKILEFQVNENSEIVFKKSNLTQRHIQGVKEILCYLSQCRKEYKVLRINSAVINKNYPYKINFPNHSIQFKIEGPILKFFDPHSNVELEYLWSLFKDGDLFKELSQL